jgi:hypothetical protein
VSRHRFGFAEGKRRNRLETKRTASLGWNAVARTSRWVTKRAPRICRTGSSPSRHASRGWSRVGALRPYAGLAARKPFLRPIASLENPGTKTFTTITVFRKQVFVWSYGGKGESPPSELARRIRVTDFTQCDQWPYRNRKRMSTVETDSVKKTDSV